MCVDTKDFAWERPAAESDCGILSAHFPDVDFKGLLQAMSQENARPLTVDLALVGAMMNTKADDLGMRYVPFTGVEENSCNVVKLPVMDQIAPWLENSALGTDMWNNASDWCEKQNGTRVHFAMNCGCGLVAVSAYKTGQWASWKERFNTSRAHLFGCTTVVQRNTNSVEGLDITETQLTMWHRIRQCLEALPVEKSREEKLAA